MARLTALVIVASSGTAIAAPQQFYLRLESTGRAYGPFRFQDKSKVRLVGRTFTLQTAPAKTKAPNAAKPAVAPNASAAGHTVLRQWKPNHNPDGYGAEILLNRDLNEADLVALVRRWSKGHDPVNILIFSSRAAYEAAKNDQFGEAFARGYILFYVKNLSGRGAYRGFNEIRWMQEKGKFAAKFGTKAKM